MSHSQLADLIAVFHLSYFLFIVVGQAVILVGWIAQWSFVRNFYFRALHLAAMTIVGIEAIFAIQCPLTVWERNLRELAGETTDKASFMARLANEVMFHDFPEWVFTAAHIAFAAAVVITFLLCPPRWPWGRKAMPLAKVDAG
jgi:hypothetical protein